MSKTDLLFARYDRRFYSSDRVLAMPAKVRAAAYCLLLSMNGYAYDHAHSGRLTWLEASMLADKLGQRPRPLLSALERADLISIEGSAVVLPRFLKWNPELEISQKRAQAGRAGAMARWGGKTDGKRISNRNGKGPLKDLVSRIAKRATEEEREGEEEGFTPLATSRLLTREAEAICQAFAARGCTLTQVDLQDAEGMVSDFRAPTVTQFTAEMLNTDQWRREHEKPPLSRVIGYREAFRRLNDRLRDEHQPPRREERTEPEGPAPSALESSEVSLTSSAAPPG